MPYIPESCEALVAKLRQEAAHLSRWFVETRYPDFQTVVYLAVFGGNTFRSFQKMPEPPSRVFRAWGNAVLDAETTVQELKVLRSSHAFDIWLDKRVQNLANYWMEHMGADRPMRFGPSRKLTDLLMKHLIRWEGWSLDEQMALIPLLHVPLETFTLSTLRPCLPKLTMGEVGPRISRTPTMGTVEDMESYTALQALARRVAADAGVPPIYLDVLAWNERHPKYAVGSQA